ncbi:hypothetical protein MQE23_42980 [Streptomyces sp. HP-A2021]|uniref:hypothetical protein n=1 Tax=Streptomyces sp. HP-A2021 TaxID=2927875 RepID=UPI001FAFBC80|nr:hypothetical protein [Streptomyces sp. HP-A2021]UOB15387.1 hypothetical protein MQE23_42980 [Streptomyces sp. HP-A2021]
MVAGAGALVALVVAYRRQRVEEDGALREATRLHTERFTTAVSQLGDDSAAVRLGGVHALAGLADDAPNRELRQTCIDVVCAYLRLIRDNLRLSHPHPRSWQGHDFDFTSVVFDGGDFTASEFAGDTISFSGQPTEFADLLKRALCGMGAPRRTMEFPGEPRLVVGPHRRFQSAELRPGH